MRFRAEFKGVARWLTVGFGNLFLDYSSQDAPRVLCYHGICENPQDEWAVTPREFRWQMQTLSQLRNPVPIRLMIDWLEGRSTIPPKAVAVTFDDGLLEVLEYAAPILEEYQIPATLFVATGLVSMGICGADPSFSVSRPLMGWNDIRKLHNAGWSIGSHSITHPKLALLKTEQVLKELQESRQDVEQHIGEAVDLLAYPYGTPGTVSQRDQKLAREAGYHAAFMNVTSPLTLGADMMALPRSKVLGVDRSFAFRGILDGGMDMWRFVERIG